MRFNITTRTDGLQSTRNRITTIQRAPQKTLEEVAKMGVDATKHRITQSKTGPDGQPWAPWSMATIRANRGKGGSLLFRTGALNNSIEYRISEKTLTIYSNVGYAKYLQFGTPKMPARPFLGWSQADINKIKKILQDNTQ